MFRIVYPDKEFDSQAKKMSTEKFCKHLRYKQMCSFVFEGIERYNNLPSGSPRMFKTTPNIMEDALDLV
jgi:hypothetical protein